MSSRSLRKFLTPVPKDSDNMPHLQADDSEYSNFKIHWTPKLQKG